MEEQQEIIAPSPDILAAEIPAEANSAEPSSPDSDNPAPVEMGDIELRAVVEAVVYITEEPLSAE